MSETTKQSNSPVIQSYYDMLYLVSCAINAVMPDGDRVSRMNMEAVSIAAKRHSLDAIAFSAAEPFLNEDKYKQMPAVIKWQKSPLLSLSKETVMDAEREQLLSFMEREGIRYMPLKGIILKKMYPETWQRQMSDNDILFDKAYWQKIYDWFMARGYTAVSVGEVHDDIYRKPPFCSFELNRFMVEKKINPVWADYYCTIWDRLLPQEGTKFGYRFSDEDFYIYMIVHAAAHVKCGGTGLRTPLDCYVFLGRKKTSMDWAYIRRELKKLGLSEYEQGLRELSETIFSDPLHFDVGVLSEKQRMDLNGILEAGTYGTIKNAVDNRIEELRKKEDGSSRKAKLRYCVRRIFPPMEYYENIPFVGRHKWAIPFYFFHRIIRGIVKNGSRIFAELRCVWRKKDRDSKPG